MQDARFHWVLLAIVCLLGAGLAGCGEPKEDRRVFRVEFRNDTSDEWITYELGGYVYWNAGDEEAPRETSHDGLRPRGVMIGPNSSTPGKHDEKEYPMEAWWVYSFESYLISDYGREDKKFPIDATKCPGIDPVTFSVRAYDSPLGQVAYDYNLNCP